jgi:tetratricopeptide (TPR) repeat protein
MSDRISYRYWAFIGYSTKDEKWAQWLLRAIETYGIPAHLVRHPTPAGDPAPKRFKPIFHAREDLAASDDLGAEIQAALRASRYLIVVCSPHAARSRWVNKEIQIFQHLGQSRRLLALIVSGEPNAGNDQECFPPALRAIEPIAADARPNGDGKLNAKLKLLAGMLGVGFDALKQRDTRRRMRRLQLFLSLALSIAVGFGLLALYAEHQREEAVKARKQAEGILEYLLFDLSSELRPIGRLDIVQDVQRRVDSYYRELGSGDGEMRLLRNRAVANNENGDRALAQGDVSGALRYYRAALATTEGLVLSSPGIDPLKRDLSVSHMKMGSVLQAQGDLLGALREYKAALAIRENLVASYPGVADLQWDLESTHHRIGQVLYQQGDVDGALREHKNALAIVESLAASDRNNRDWQYELAVSHGMIGVALQARGDSAESVGEQRAGLSIMKRLASLDPKNVKYQEALAIGDNNYAESLEGRGDFAGALHEYRAALEIIGKLAPSDPSNLRWLKTMTSIQENVDRVQQAQHRP